MSDRPGPVVPESTYSTPSVMCPHPERWHCTDDHSTEIEVSEMVAGLVRGLQPQLCIETGTAWGQTAEAIGAALALNGAGSLVSLEVDEERADYSASRCIGLPVNVQVTESLSYVPTGQVDFAFFDSLFGLRVPEFLWFRPYMHSGTVVAFHDTAPGHGGGQLPNDWDLRQHIDHELVAPGGLIDVVHFPTPRGITVGVVR